jgi:hypothetical protein
MIRGTYSMAEFSKSKYVTAHAEFSTFFEALALLHRTTIVPLRRWTRKLPYQAQAPAIETHPFSPPANTEQKNQYQHQTFKLFKLRSPLVITSYEIFSS